MSPWYSFIWRLMCLKAENSVRRQRRKQHNPSKWLKNELKVRAKQDVRRLLARTGATGIPTHEITLSPNGKNNLPGRNWPFMPIISDERTRYMQTFIFLFWCLLIQISDFTLQGRRSFTQQGHEAYLKSAKQY